MLLLNMPQVYTSSSFLFAVMGLKYERKVFHEALRKNLCCHSHLSPAAHHRPRHCPVAHAGVNWGTADGAIIGGLLSQGSNNSNKSENSGSGLFGGLSNQKHARQNPTSEEKLFLLAVEKIDFETAQSMFDAGVDINGVYPSHIGIGRGFNYSDQDTAFSIAINQNNRDMMQFLLERGADIRGWYTYRGNFCSYIELYLHKYNGSADLSLLQYLLDWGANVNEYSISLDGKKIYPIDHCTQGYDSAENCYTTQFLLKKGLIQKIQTMMGGHHFLKLSHSVNLV